MEEENCSSGNTSAKTVDCCSSCGSSINSSNGDDYSSVGECHSSSNDDLHRIYDDIGKPLPKLQKQEKQERSNKLSSDNMSEFYPARSADYLVGADMTVSHFPWLPALQNRSSSLSSSCVAAVGIMGVALGVAGIIAYAIMQVPALRKSLYVYPEYDYTYGGSNSNQSSNISIISGVSTAGEVAYGYELAGVFIGTSLGIMVNAILIYGTCSQSSSFLLPWLVFQTFFIALLLLSALLVLVLAGPPAVLKAFAAIPIAAAVIELLLWVVVYRHYAKLRRRALAKSMELSLMSYGYGLSAYSVSTGAGHLGWTEDFCCQSNHSYPVGKLQKQEGSSGSTYHSFSDL